MISSPSSSKKERSLKTIALAKICLVASVLVVLKCASVSTSRTSFLHPTLEVEDVNVGDDSSSFNPCANDDLEWNRRDVRHKTMIWLRKLTALPHFRGVLHLPSDNRRNILILQFFEQVNIFFKF